MKNLKLISRLQPSDMVSLHLIQKAGDQLDYYIVANSINYTVVCSGNCIGDIGGGHKEFSILMSSVYPIVEKGYELHLRYLNGVLEFYTEDERLCLRPLCVEAHDVNSLKVVEKAQRYGEVFTAEDELKKALVREEQELEEAQHHYSEVQKMQLEGIMTSSNPFGDIAALKPQETLEKVITEKKETIAELQRKVSALKRVDMKPFKIIANAAARAHEMVAFCDTYAVVSLKSTFLLQKGPCPAMTVQGPLLQQLIRYSDGDGFSWFENGLVYAVGEKTGEKTYVFFEKYLPNTSVDSSIVTKGVVYEKQELSMKGILKVAQLLKSKFPEMTLDLGEGKLILANDKGEQVITSYEVEDVDNAELRKMIKDPSYHGKMNGYTISIPAEVQSLLSLFRDKMKVYVKAKKIILQSDDFYVVFGR